MKLNLYNKNLKRIAVIESRYVSCMWSEGYNSTQPFTMELQASDEYKQKVQPDCYVGRDDRKTMMVIKTVKVKDGVLKGGGKQLVNGTSLSTENALSYIYSKMGYGLLSGDTLKYVNNLMRSSISSGKFAVKEGAAE